MVSGIHMVIIGCVLFSVFGVLPFALHANIEQYYLKSCVELKKLIDSGQYDGWHGMNPDLTETYGNKCIK